MALRLAQTVEHHPELADLLTAWPTLPAAVKAGIAAMVQAAGGHDAGGQA
ncbi:hypothetical protein HED60_22530 [Planctomycetales bacterium ZRK34]|nr:hypothetical protein HED60_22530 [Planctomycetales bacterium ZRK34]